MNHLDEGTIHAWLDGALDAAQAAEVEAHVGSCAQCADAVAEARGIIAASSRILMALDDDRVNVVPRAPGAPSVKPIVPRRPMRRTAPWVIGIAATLVVAISLRTTRMSEDVAFRKSATLVSAPVAEGADSAHSVPAPTAPQPAAIGSAAAPPAGRQSVARGELKREVGRIAGVASRAPGVGEGSAERRAVAPLAAPAAPPIATAAATELQQRVESDIREQTRVAKAADQGAALRAVPTVVAMTPTERLAGCYRLDAGTVAGPDVGNSPSERAGAANAVRARGARVSSAPAASAARADFVDTRALSVIRLDTTRAALGMAVVRIPDTSAVGAWRILRDSARVDLGTRGIVMLGLTQKVSCPEP